MQFSNSTNGVMCALATVLLLVSGTGCERNQDSQLETAADTALHNMEEGAAVEESEESEATGPATAAANGGSDSFEPLEGWTIVAEDELSGPETATLSKMNEARQNLAQSLMGALSAHIASEGPVSAVEFCSNQAGPIAARVSEETRVAVGRTSFKLRNQDNAPKPWMNPIVEARYASPVVMRGQGGVLAASHPIPVGAACLRCHGESDAIDAEVLAAIDEHYSADEATGFSEGDLRGWFWTEATVASLNP